MDSCNSSFETSLAHCTPDCIRQLLQSFLLCTTLDVFVCSAAKCKTFSSWGEFNWGSSSWTCCWDSEIVHFCTWGIRGETAQKIVIYCFCLASDKNWVLSYSILSFLFCVSCQSQMAKDYAVHSMSILVCSIYLDVPQSFPVEYLW